MAIRTRLPDRPAAKEQKAHISRQTEKEHKDRPGDSLTPGKAERTTSPLDQDGQDERQSKDGASNWAMNLSAGPDGREVAPWRIVCDHT